MSPDVARVAAKAYESAESRVKDETTVATPGGGGGSIVTVAATKGAVVVSALLDKTRDTQQCARAMVVELPRRGDSKDRKTAPHKQAKVDLAENEKPRDIVTSTTTPEGHRASDAETVRQVAHESEKKTDDGAIAPEEKTPSAIKDKTRVVGAPEPEARIKDVVVTAATSFTDKFRAAQRSSGVSPPVSCDVTSADTDRAVKAPTSPVAFHEVASGKSPKTGSDRHTPEARLPSLHPLTQDVDKHRVTSVDSCASEIRPVRLDSLGMTAPSIYQFR